MTLLYFGVKINDSKANKMNIKWKLPCSYCITFSLKFKFLCSQIATTSLYSQILSKPYLSLVVSLRFSWNVYQKHLLVTQW